MNRTLNIEADYSGFFVFSICMTTKVVLLSVSFMMCDVSIAYGIAR